MLKKKRRHSAPPTIDAPGLTSKAGTPSAKKTNDREKPPELRKGPRGTPATAVRHQLSHSRTGTKEPAMSSTGQPQDAANDKNKIRERVPT